MTHERDISAVAILPRQRAPQIRRLPLEVSPSTVAMMSTIYSW